LAWYAGLGWALKARARYAEAVEAYTAACTAADAGGDRVAQAHAWNDLASAQESRGDFRDSLESAARAETLARGAGEAGWAEHTEALLRQSQAAFRLGEIAQALDLAGQGLALCEAAEPRPDARRLQARALNLLGAAHVRAGQFAPGMRCREQALALYRDLDNRQGMAMVLNNLASGAGQRGDHAMAAARLQEALAIMGELGDRDGELLCLQNLGTAQVQLGEYGAAEESARRCIAMLGTTRWWLAVDLYCCLADACAGQGKMPEALEAARQALDLAQQTGSEASRGTAWQTMGHCSARLAESGVPVPAVPDPPACYAESLRAFEACRMDASRAYVLRDWARYELAHGDRARGAEMWREARALFERLAMPLEVSRMDAHGTGQ
jgi:tetratricopeptide (TPR) repeat protein